MAKIARLIAAAGALAGGYMQGKKMQEDAEWEKEKRQQERDAMQREADVRQAAASTLGAVGTQTGGAVSGEDALAAGNQALTDAISRAKTPEEVAAVKANFEPTMTALVAQQGVPAQAGSTYTEDQASKDYIAKIRGIDPTRARQEQLGQLQVNKEQRNEDYEKGKNAAFAATPWAKAVAEGRKATPGEQLQSAATLFAYDAQNGKATPQGMMEIASKMQSHETENYTKAVQALHSGASKDTIAKVFNASGMQIDPASISDPRPVEVDIGGGQKVKTFEITYTDASGRAHTLNGRRELDALGKGAESFSQAVKLAELKNDTIKAGAAASSAASTVALHGAQADEIKQKTADRKDLATIHAALNAAIDAKDAAAEKTERAKLSAFVSGGRGAQSMSPEERKANFYLASGKAKTMEEAATMAHQKVQASAADDFREFSKPNSMGMAPDKKQVDEFMALQHGPNWKSKLPGGGGAGGVPAKAGWGVRELK